MSRIAKMPVKLPQGVNATIAADRVTVKGAKGSLSLPIASGISVAQKDQTLLVVVAEGKATTERVAAAGATRANLANMVAGVTRGFERKLELVGVGYRAAVQGRNLNLTLGFSHPVSYPVPEGISIETPSQTEILIKGADLQRVGQVAAEIRGYRPPEPYKGKGERPAHPARDPRPRQDPRDRHGAPDGAPYAAAHLCPGHDARRRARAGHGFDRAGSGGCGPQGDRKQRRRGCRGPRDRRACESGRHRVRGFRPLGFPLSRACEGARRRRARSRPQVLIPRITRWHVLKDPSPATT
jgi:large subunit ribosomal protein L6